jgi:hypothetical protein
MYASTILLYWERSPAETVVVPYSLDTPFTPIALDDVAEATAAVLSEDGHEFATYELGGPEVLTGRQMLALSARSAASLARSVSAICRSWPPRRLERQRPGLTWRLCVSTTITSGCRGAGGCSRCCSGGRPPGSSTTSSRRAKRG